MLTTAAFCTTAAALQPAVCYWCKILLVVSYKRAGGQADSPPAPWSLRAARATIDTAVLCIQSVGGKRCCTYSLMLVQVLSFFFFFWSHFTFQLLDKLWSQVSSLLPPGTCLHFYRA